MERIGACVGSVRGHFGEHEITHGERGCILRSSATGSSLRRCGDFREYGTRRERRRYSRRVETKGCGGSDSGSLHAINRLPGRDEVPGIAAEVVASDDKVGEDEISL